MWRRPVRLIPTALIPIFKHVNENDYNTLDRTVRDEPKTGWERVKKMYSKNEYEDLSLELHNVIQATLCGGFFGACFGGFTNSREAYLYFIETNQATIFKSTLDAKRKLQDRVTLAFGKGAFYWGWRLAVFTGMFSIIVNTIAVYRNDTSIVEYVSAGAVTGALYRANLGTAASLVGAGLGAALSTVGGLLILGILKITGLSLADIKIALHKIKEARQEQYSEAVEKAATIKSDNLTRHHDYMVESKGEIKVEELN